MYEYVRSLDTFTYILCAELFPRILDSRDSGLANKRKNYSVAKKTNFTVNDHTCTYSACIGTDSTERMIVAETKPPPPEEALKS